MQRDRRYDNMFVVAIRDPGEEPEKDVANGIIYHPDKIRESSNIRAIQAHNEIYNGNSIVSITRISGYESPEEIYDSMLKKFNIIGRIVESGLIIKFRASEKESMRILEEIGI